ncbi:hypothetical protein [Burkholderia territorii]|uniref:hypothetical protein n=1 Tax=Burkholderia territorii TaxID=1503055 RepID=UPI0012D9BF0F|nr:hypothetical protein [Burkholderia territorii]
MPQTRTIIEVVVGVSILVASYFYHLNEMHQQKKIIEGAYTEQIVKAYQKKADTELKLNNDLIKANKEKDEKLADVNARYNDLLKRLQNRPSRSTAVAATASAGSSCTGAELYREDGQFLAREAARAEQVRIQRDYYYDAYERARDYFARQGFNVGRDGTVQDTKSVP